MTSSPAPNDEPDSAWLAEVKPLPNLSLDGVTFFHTFFSGRIEGRGYFIDRFGRVRVHFSLRLVGRREQEKLQVSERLIYDDGQVDKRSWTLTALNNGNVQGVGPEVIGRITGGAPAGTSEVRLSYRLKLAMGGMRIVVRIDDRFLRLSERDVINLSYISKWGIRLGVAVTLMQRKNPHAVPIP